jgi:ABC-type oligopeptide transport system substrate-binding subunit
VSYRRIYSRAYYLGIKFTLCVVAILALLLSGSCGESESNGEKDISVNRSNVVRQLCQLSRRSSNITAVMNIQGSVVHGDVANTALNQMSGVWTSMYGITARTYYSRENHRWYDGSPVYAIGRSLNKDVARRTARKACESLARDFVSQYLVNSDYTDCDEVVTQEC